VTDFQVWVQKIQIVKQRLGEHYEERQAKQASRKQNENAIPHNAKEQRELCKYHCCTPHLEPTIPIDLGTWLWLEQQHKPADEARWQARRKKETIAGKDEWKEQSHAQSHVSSCP
jgi:hypothetical protein